MDTGGHHDELETELRHCLTAILVPANIASAQVRGMRGVVAEAANGHGRLLAQCLTATQSTVQSSGSYGNGQFTRDKAITGPNGKQATVNTTGTYGNGNPRKKRLYNLDYARSLTLR